MITFEDFEYFVNNVIDECNRPKCSNCNREADTIDSVYCPRCGTKLDSEDNDTFHGVSFELAATFSDKIYDMTYESIGFMDDTFIDIKERDDGLVLLPNNIFDLLVEFVKDGYSLPDLLNVIMDMDDLNNYNSRQQGEIIDKFDELIKADIEKRREEILKTIKVTIVEKLNGSI